MSRSRNCHGAEHREGGASGATDRLTETELACMSIWQREVGQAGLLGRSYERGSGTGSVGPSQLRPLPTMFITPATSSCSLIYRAPAGRWESADKKGLPRAAWATTHRRVQRHTLAPPHRPASPFVVPLRR